MIVNRKHAVEAATLLGLDTEIPMHMDQDVVQAAYRERCKVVHPDMAGGSVEAFAAVDRAKHILLEWIKRPNDERPVLAANRCAPCDGKGNRRVTHGFRTSYVTCLSCRGTGDANYDSHGADS